MQHEHKGRGRTAVLMDPHPICHAAIAALLAELDITVVAAATTASCTQALLQEHAPDVLVAELELLEGRDAALETIGRCRHGRPELVVVVLSGCGEPELVERAFAAGASAYVLKSSEPDVVATAIRQAFEPSIYLARPRSAGLAAVPTSPAPQLTRRELEILRLVSEGRSNRQVGKLLWVTDQTVKFHLANVYRKLGVGSRQDAAQWAFRHGLLQESAGSGGAVVPITATGNGNGSRPPVRGRPHELGPRNGLREGTSR